MAQRWSTGVSARAWAASRASSTGLVTAALIAAASPLQAQELAAPVPLGPPNDPEWLIPYAWTLTWSGVAGTRSYQVQVDDEANFATPVIDRRTPSHNLWISLLESSTSYHWRVRALAADDTSAWSPVRRFRTLDPLEAPEQEIPHVDSADLPTIDGDLSDWESLFDEPALQHSQFSSAWTEVTGPVPEDDQRVAVWLGWNDETDLIYVAARVEDDHFGTTTSREWADTYRSDNIEVYIDGDNSGGVYSLDDPQAQHYLLTPAGWDKVYLRGLHVATPEAESVGRRAGTTYTYELALPAWETIAQDGTGVRHRLEAGDVIGLSFMFADMESDADADAARFHAMNALFGAEGLWANADQFADFRLLPPPDRTAPGAPQGLAVEGGREGAWSSSSRFALSWTNPEDRSGIARTHYKVGGAPEGRDDRTGTTDGSGPVTIEVAEDGVHEVYVWLEDGEGNADHTQASSVVLRYDATPPVITATAPTSVDVGRYLSPEYAWADISPVDSVVFFYRVGGDEVFTAMAMVEDDSGGMTAETPVPPVSVEGIEYYLTATDAAGNTATFPSEAPGEPATVEVTFRDQLSPNPFAVNQWRMVSVPFQLGNGSPHEILAGFGVYDDTQWRLFRYQYGRYRELTEVDIGDFEPGQAFWLHTRIEGVRVRSGSGSVTPLGHPYEITLQPGWTDIGTPFAFQVAWDDILAASGDPAGVAGPYAYDGESWSFPEPTSVLTPWEGYAVKNSGTAAVVLSVPPLAATRSAKSVARGQGAAADWRLQIQATGEAGSDVHNYLGFHPDAADEWDRLDLPEPPAAPGSGVRLYFPHLEWQEYPDLYTSDMRPHSGGASWDVVVEVSDPAETVTLTLTGSAAAPDGMEVRLLDLDGHIALAVRDGEPFGLSFGSEGGHRHLRVVVGGAAFVAAVSAENRPRPSGLALHPNHPNPFNGGTNIAYEVPRWERVRLAVYDVLGQEVAVLAEGARDAGYFTASWDGRNAEGRPVASGVYVAVLETSRRRLVQKMSVLR